MAAALVAPAPAYSQTTTNCMGDPNDVIEDINPGAAINCTNIFPRTGANGLEPIDLRTNGDGESVTLDTEDLLTATDGVGNTRGIRVRTGGTDSDIDVDSRGNIDVNANNNGQGIDARVGSGGGGNDSSITIDNTGRKSVFPAAG
ncbi:MAG: hypothetical protein AAF492_00330 [Verrucomicrobiota bacterium]